MALTFTDGGDEIVNHGSAATLDNVNTGTILAWVYVSTSSPTADGRICQKDTYPDSHLLFWIDQSTPSFIFQIHRATTHLKIDGAWAQFSNFSAPAWNFVATSFDTGGANADQKLFVGSRSALASEPGAYATQTVGAGAVGDDSAADLVVGNHPALGFGFPGRIALIAIWKSVDLSQAEIRQQQFVMGHPVVQPSSCVLFCNYGFNGTGTQRDWSGNSNDGTVTDATVGAHVPLGPIGFDIPLIYIIAAVTRQPRLVAYFDGPTFF